MAKSGYYDSEALSAFRKSAEEGVEGDDSVWAGLKPAPRPYIIRILPSWRVVKQGKPKTQENLKFWLTVFHHGKESLGPHQDRTLVCPKHTRVGDGKCPICTMREAAEQSGTAADRALAYALRAYPKHYVNVSFPEEPNKGVRVWGMPDGVYKELVNKHYDSRWGPLDDPDNGRDIEVLVSLKSGTQFYEYSVSCAPERSALELEDWEEQLQDLEAVVLRNVPTYDQLEQLCKGVPSKKVFARNKVELDKTDVGRMTAAIAEDIFGGGKKSSVFASPKKKTQITEEEEDEEEDDIPMKFKPGKKLSLSSDKPKKKKLELF